MPKRAARSRAFHGQRIPTITSIRLRPRFAGKRRTPESDSPRTWILADCQMDRQDDRMHPGGHAASSAGVHLPRCRSAGGCLADLAGGEVGQRAGIQDRGRRSGRKDGDPRQEPDRSRALRLAQGHRPMRHPQVGLRSPEQSTMAWHACHLCRAGAAPRGRHPLSAADRGMGGVPPDPGRAPAPVSGHHHPGRRSIAEQRLYDRFAWGKCVGDDLLRARTRLWC